MWKSTFFAKDQTPASIAKHKVLLTALSIWFDETRQATIDLLYIDGYSGAGRHEKCGSIGSPLLALKCASLHSHLHNRLTFLFFENKLETYLQLKTNLNLLNLDKEQSNKEEKSKEVKEEQETDKETECKGEQNGEEYITTVLGFKVIVIHGDFAAKIRSSLHQHVQATTPTSFFSFLDPYGYKLPIDLVKWLKNNNHQQTWEENDKATATTTTTTTTTTANQNRVVIYLATAAVRTALLQKIKINRTALDALLGCQRLDQLQENCQELSSVDAYRAIIAAVCEEIRTNNGSTNDSDTKNIQITELREGKSHVLVV